MEKKTDQGKETWEWWRRLHFKGTRTDNWTKVERSNELGIYLDKTVSTSTLPQKADSKALRQECTCSGQKEEGRLIWLKKNEQERTVVGNE